MLTEVLLEVTNEEVDKVAGEVYMKAKHRASKGTPATSVPTPHHFFTNRLCHCRSLPSHLVY